VPRAGRVKPSDDQHLADQSPSACLAALSRRCVIADHARLAQQVAEERPPGPSLPAHLTGELQELGAVPDGHVADETPPLAAGMHATRVKACSPTSEHLHS
jgi:hypothetical protein